MPSLTTGLNENGYCLFPGFLAGPLQDELREDLQTLRAGGRFKPAGIGAGAQKQVRDEIRRDEICWLDPEDGPAARLALFRRIEDLRISLNQELFLGLKDFEGHYSLYPAGGFYKRHLDRFKNDNARKVSLVLYLNRDWKPADGGQLRLFTNGGGFIDIDPVGGTLVCFISDEIEHEVLTSHASRIAFTGWFKTTS